MVLGQCEGEGERKYTEWLHGARKAEEELALRFAQINTAKMQRKSRMTTEQPKKQGDRQAERHSPPAGHPTPLFSLLLPPLRVAPHWLRKADGWSNL